MLGLGLKTNVIVQKSPYGPELVVNGGFDDATGWNVEGESSISGGEGRILSTGAYSILAQTVSPLTVGKTYRITYNVVSTDGVNLTNNASTITWETDTTGEKEQVFVASDDQVNFKRIAACDITLDNVSVKEVL